jgi:hypothetical protein
VDHLLHEAWNGVLFILELLFHSFLELLDGSPVFFGIVVVLLCVVVMIVYALFKHCYDLITNGWESICLYAVIGTMMQLGGNLDLGGHSNPAIEN